MIYELAYMEQVQVKEKHDHGSGFRVLKNNIPKVFKVEEI